MTHIWEETIAMPSEKTSSESSIRLLGLFLMFFPPENHFMTKYSLPKFP